MELTHTNLLTKAAEYKKLAYEYQPMDDDDMTAARYFGQAAAAETAAWAVVGGTAVKIEDSETLISMGCTQRRVNVARQYTQYDNNVDMESKWFGTDDEMLESFEYEGRNYYVVSPKPVYATRRPVTQAELDKLIAEAEADEAAAKESVSTESIVTDEPVINADDEIVSAYEAAKRLSIETTIMNNPVRDAMKNKVIDGAYKTVYQGSAQWVATWGAVKTWHEGQSK